MRYCRSIKSCNAAFKMVSKVHTVDFLDDILCITPAEKKLGYTFSFGFTSKHVYGKSLSTSEADVPAKLPLDGKE